MKSFRQFITEKAVTTVTTGGAGTNTAGYPFTAEPGWLGSEPPPWLDEDGNRKPGWGIHPLPHGGESWYYNPFRDDTTQRQGQRRGQEQGQGQDGREVANPPGQPRKPQAMPGTEIDIVPPSVRQPGIDDYVPPPYTEPGPSKHPIPWWWRGIPWHKLPKY